MSLSVSDETVTTKDRIPVFRSISIYEDYIIITSSISISKVGKEAPEEARIWKRFELFRVGDIVRSVTEQSDESWEILEIKENKIKFHYYGFLKGVGKFDEVFWVTEYS